MFALMIFDAQTLSASIRSFVKVPASFRLLSVTCPVWLLLSCGFKSWALRAILTFCSFWKKDCLTAKCKILHNGLVSLCFYILRSLFFFSNDTFKGCGAQNVLSVLLIIVESCWGKKQYCWKYRNQKYLKKHKWVIANFEQSTSFWLLLVTLKYYKASSCAVMLQSFMHICSP